MRTWQSKFHDSGLGRMDYFPCSHMQIQCSSLVHTLNKIIRTGTPIIDPKCVLYKAAAGLSHYTQCEIQL